MQIPCIYTEDIVLVYIIALSILYCALKLVQKTKCIIKHTNIIYMTFSKILSLLLNICNVYKVIAINIDSSKYIFT